MLAVDGRMLLEMRHHQQQSNGIRVWMARHLLWIKVFLIFISGIKSLLIKPNSAYCFVIGLFEVFQKYCKIVKSQCHFSVFTGSHQESIIFYFILQKCRIKITKTQDHLLLCFCSAFLLRRFFYWSGESPFLHFEEASSARLMNK